MSCKLSKKIEAGSSVVLRTDVVIGEAAADHLRGKFAGKRGFGVRLASMAGDLRDSGEAHRLIMTTPTVWIDLVALRHDIVEAFHMVNPAAEAVTGRLCVTRSGRVDDNDVGVLGKFDALLQSLCTGIYVVAVLRVADGEVTVPKDGPCYIRELEQFGIERPGPAVLEGLVRDL